MTTFAKVDNVKSHQDLTLHHNKMAGQGRVLSFQIDDGKQSKQQHPDSKHAFVQQNVSPGSGADHSSRVHCIRESHQTSSSVNPPLKTHTSTIKTTPVASSVKGVTVISTVKHSSATSAGNNPSFTSPVKSQHGTTAVKHPSVTSSVTSSSNTSTVKSSFVTSGGNDPSATVQKSPSDITSHKTSPVTATVKSPSAGYFATKGPIRSSAGQRSTVTSAWKEPPVTSAAQSSHVAAKGGCDNVTSQSSLVKSAAKGSLITSASQSSYSATPVKGSPSATVSAQNPSVSSAVKGSPNTSVSYAAKGSPNTSASYSSSVNPVAKGPQLISSAQSLPISSSGKTTPSSSWTTHTTFVSTTASSTAPKSSLNSAVKDPSTISAAPNSSLRSSNKEDSSLAHKSIQDSSNVRLNTNPNAQRPSLMSLKDFEHLPSAGQEGSNRSVLVTKNTGIRTNNPENNRGATSEKDIERVSKIIITDKPDDSSDEETEDQLLQKIDSLPLTQLVSSAPDSPLLKRRNDQNVRKGVQWEQGVQEISQFTYPEDYSEDDVEYDDEDPGDDNEGEVPPSLAHTASQAVSGYRTSSDADLYVHKRKLNLILARAPPAPSGILRGRNRRSSKGSSVKFAEKHDVILDQ